jgi:hypothetical protein
MLVFQVNLLAGELSSSGFSPWHAA